jgi:hypothetical protein
MKSVRAIAGAVVLIGFLIAGVYLPGWVIIPALNDYTNIISEFPTSSTITDNLTVRNIYHRGKTGTPLKNTYFWIIEANEISEIIIVSGEGKNTYQAGTTVLPNEIEATYPKDHIAVTLLYGSGFTTGSTAYIAFFMGAMIIGVLAYYRITHGRKKQNEA